MNETLCYNANIEQDIANCLNEIMKILEKCWMIVTIHHT